MKRYILSSKKLNYSMELWYNDKGLLCRLDMINCDMTQDQLEAFASKLNLSEKNIKASIDLKDKKEGTYEVVVDIEIPEGYELVDEVKTQIEVSRISKAEENS